MSVPYEIEVDAELWDNFEHLCEKLNMIPLDELSTCLEEYITSIQEENEDL